MTDDREEIIEYEPWYRYGVMVLYLEMFIAIVVSIFALILTLTGSGGISRH